MASTINASNTGAGGLVYSADSSGVLVLQAAGANVVTANSTTVTLGSAITLSQSGAMIANGSTGTSGQFLTSSGTSTYWSAPVIPGSNGTTASGSVTLTSTSAGAQSVTPTDYGQYVKLPDATTMSMSAVSFNVRNAGVYPLKIYDNGNNIIGFLESGKVSSIGLASNTTANGTWVASGTVFHSVTGVYSASTTALQGYRTFADAIALDSTRLMFFFYKLAGGSLYAIIFNESTNTWGTPTVVATTSSLVFAPLLISPGTVLIATAGAGVSAASFTSVVLTSSGTTITVNTPSTKTLGANTINDSTYNNVFGKPFYASSLVAVGNTYVWAYNTSVNSTLYQVMLLPMSVSGSNVTVGAETTFMANAYVSGPQSSSSYYTGAANSTVLIAAAWSGNGSVGTLSVQPYSVSGNSITAGTSANISSATIQSYFKVIPISSGARNILVYKPTSSTISVAAISVSAGPTVNLVSSKSTGLFAAATADKPIFSAVDGSKLILLSANSSTNTGLCVVTDNNGNLTVSNTITIRNNNYGSYTHGHMYAINNTATAFVGGSGVYYDYGKAAYSIKVDYSGDSPKLIYGGGTYDQNQSERIPVTFSTSYGTDFTSSYNLDGTPSQINPIIMRNNNADFMMASIGPISSTNTFSYSFVKSSNGVTAVTQDGPRISWQGDKFVAGATANTRSYYFMDPYLSNTATDSYSFTRVEFVTSIN